MAYKVNIVDIRGKSVPKCTNCGHEFDTDVAKNPYKEMYNIARGKFRFCPACGAKYVGFQVNSLDFSKCDLSVQSWILRGTYE